MRNNKTPSLDEVAEKPSDYWAKCCGCNTHMEEKEIAHVNSYGDEYCRDCTSAIIDDLQIQLAHPSEETVKAILEILADDLNIEGMNKAILLSKQSLIMDKLKNKE